MRTMPLGSLAPTVDDGLQCGQLARWLRGELVVQQCNGQLLAPNRIDTRRSPQWLVACIDHGIVAFAEEPRPIVETGSNQLPRIKSTS